MIIKATYKTGVTYEDNRLTSEEFMKKSPEERRKFVEELPNRGTLKEAKALGLADAVIYDEQGRFLTIV